MGLQFTPIQHIATTGARAVEPFTLDGTLFLAIAQMAVDVPGQAPGINAGSSRATMPILRWQSGRFEPFSELSVPGGEDAEFFRIGERMFLATASIRTGDGPYDLNAQSTVFEWRDGRFAPLQTFPTFAAKQWRHFEIDGRHFLALAQGVVMPGATARHPSQSTIFAWDGAQFAELQTVRSGWGYNFRHISIAGRHLLAYSDHATPSLLLEWTGQEFRELEALEGKSGRTVCAFESGGAHWLAVANLLEDSYLARWTGSRFERYQTLCGPGARELLWLPQGDGHLVQANFLLGSRAAPRPMTKSAFYAFRDGQLAPVGTFDSSAAVDVAAFQADGGTHIAVANSLAGDLRFATQSSILRMQE